MNEMWSKDFPEENGFFWFYGYPWGIGEGIKKELYFVEVGKTRNGFIYITKGNFFFEKEANGVWQKAELPELPSN